MRGTVFEAGQFVAERYRVERLLGQGGMGAVYLAHHELLQQEVAVKVLTAGNDEVARERFLREARAAAKLRSRHVVRVMDVGVLPSGELFLVMERLRGLDLDQTIAKHGPMPVPTAVDVVLELLDALAEAHAAGIVHRDLKPANLFLSEEEGKQVLKVLDFGISKSGNDELISLTSTASVMGSPLYMSPEQARSSKAVDQRADIWSIGVLLHEALIGTTPFAADTIGAVFGRIFEMDPRPLATLRPDVPPALSQIVLRCLAKHPPNRFRDCAELAIALAPFGTGTRQVCVDRAVSFSRPSHSGLTAALPSGPSSDPRLGSSPSFRDSQLGAAQTVDGWGQSQRDITMPKRSSGSLVALMAGGVFVLVLGVTLATFFLLKRRPIEEPVVAAKPAESQLIPVALPTVASSLVPTPAASVVPVVSASASATPVPTSSARALPKPKIIDLSHNKY